MEFQIKKQGDVSVRALPSVRALARQLRIHHNTISEAYQTLVDENFLVRRRGSRMIVRAPEQPRKPAPHQDLDDLINETVRRAREQGYTIQQLAERVRERMIQQPPDRILTLSPDAGLRKLMEVELRAALHFPVRSCSPDELLRNPQLAAGALVVSPPGILPSVLTVVPKIRPAIPIVYCPAEDHLEMVRRLPRPSRIGVASVSARFLEIARALLSPVTGRQHSLAEYLIEDGRAPAADTADILFCDVIARELLHGVAKRKAILYRLISPECLSQIESAIAV
jgi:DNA-binding transcriptional regulator YhcF (GntR family)